uniref:Uncharacterized protein n=1 Tax=Periophthalmus magnuspinnatus TaxID=409849 RepID=A0A3B4BKD2_9GOBI
MDGRVKRYLGKYYSSKINLKSCDSGFGQATAKHLDSLGFEVFATVLDLSSEGSQDLFQTCSSRLTLLKVDITQPQQVQQALTETRAKLGLRGKKYTNDQI